VSFIEGSAGVFFKQFGLTLAIAIMLSAVNALTLSPTLCALFLKPHHQNKLRKQGFLQRFHSAFNAGFDNTTKRYKRAIGFFAANKWLGLVGIAVFAGLFFFLFQTTPKGFVPDEDMSIIVADISLPPSSSSERTDVVIKEVEKIASSLPEVHSIFHVNGFGIFGGAGSSYGVLFMKLKDWDERKKKGQDVQSLIGKLFGMTSTIKGATVIFFAPPTLQGFGFGGGIEFQLQDRSGGDINRFAKLSQDFLAALNKRPEIQYASTAFSTNFPQYQINIDPARAKQAGIAVTDILNTMQGYYGGVYASNFNQFGKQYRVIYQAEPEFRTNPETLNRVYVRNANGTMAPITEFIQLEKVYGPQTITRFNLYTSISVNGATKPGFSSGDAIKAVTEVAAQNLPPGYGFEFSGVSREEIAAGSQTGFIFMLVIVFVYFLLCAQYESYILPFAVLFSLPIGLAGAFLFTKMLGISNNIYVQITMIMLVGLLAKNAILIVEFALDRRRKGMPITQAALEGAVVRLRPILMTSFAFIFGLLPLMFTNGAGANGNRSIGTGAVGGMFVGTVFGVFVIPTLFIIFQTLHEKIVGRKSHPTEENQPPAVEG
jgi:HAE1 family hydrophobic/amphiphilic exporter-1